MIYPVDSVIQPLNNRGLLSTDKSRYFAQPRPIIVNCIQIARSFGQLFCYKAGSEINMSLNVFLKEFKESAFLKDAGRLFHNLGPAIENR